MIIRSSSGGSSSWKECRRIGQSSRRDWRRANDAHSVDELTPTLPKLSSLTMHSRTIFAKPEEKRRRCLSAANNDPSPATVLVKVMFSPRFVCLFVCERNNSKSYVLIVAKFRAWVGLYCGRGTGLNFGTDPGRILDILSYLSIVQ